MIKKWKPILFGVMLTTLSQAPALALPPTQVATLANGLKVILVEEHKAPIATFQIWYRVGSKDEQPGRTGLSHLNEHMMFKGTKKHPKGEFSRLVAKAGGTENAFTSKDYTAFFEKLAVDRLELSLELESDRMQNLLLDPKEFALELSVVKEERRYRTDDDPQSAAVEELFAAAFKSHPYQWPIVGWMEDLNQLTVNDLRQHYQTYYNPNNAVIVVVGDINPQQLLLQIKDYFGAIPNRHQEIPHCQVTEPKQEGERRVIVHRKAELPFVIVGYHVPNLQHPDAYPLEIASYILTEGKSSRLYKQLVYEKKIAAVANGYYSRVSADPNLCYFYGELLPGKKVSDFETALYEELARLKNGEISEHELAKVKNQIEADFIMAQDSIFYQAMQIGQLEVIGVEHQQYQSQFIGNMRQVTREQVRQVAQRYFTPDNRTVSILLPKKETKNEK